jgi:hypothetical protein
MKWKKQQIAICCNLLLLLQSAASSISQSAASSFTPVTSAADSDDPITLLAAKSLVPVGRESHLEKVNIRLSFANTICDGMDNSVSDPQHSSIFGFARGRNSSTRARFKSLAFTVRGHEKKASFRLRVRRRNHSVAAGL